MSRSGNPFQMRLFANRISRDSLFSVISVTFGCFRMQEIDSGEVGTITSLGLIRSDEVGTITSLGLIRSDEVGTITSPGLIRSFRFDCSHVVLFTSV